MNYFDAQRLAESPRESEMLAQQQDGCGARVALVSSANSEQRLRHVPEEVGLHASQRDVDLDEHVALLPAVGGQGPEGGHAHVLARELRQIDAVLRTHNKRQSTRAQ